MRAALLVLALLAAGCVTPPEAPPVDGPPPGPFTLESAAFADGAVIPREYTCDGENASPPLAVSGAPEGTVALALIVGDPDAPLPQAPQRNVTHWLVWNVPVEEGGAEFPRDGVPEGAVEGANVGGDNGWTGPCPPVGSPPHRYMFTLHAVDAALGLDAGASRDELEDALGGHVLATTVLVGLYERALPPGVPS